MQTSSILSLLSLEIFVLQGDLSMFINEFNRPFSKELISDGKECEWCDKPAVQHLIAISGTHHNAEGVFCHSCGEQFSRAISEQFSQTITQMLPVIIMQPSAR
jgi:hypothetical protein